MLLHGGLAQRDTAGILVGKWDTVGWEQGSDDNPSARNSHWWDGRHGQREALSVLHLFAGGARHWEEGEASSWRPQIPGRGCTGQHRDTAPTSHGPRAQSFRTAEPRDWKFRILGTLWCLFVCF